MKMQRGFLGLVFFFLMTPFVLCAEDQAKVESDISDVFAKISEANGKNSFNFFIPDVALVLTSIGKDGNQAALLLPGDGKIRLFSQAEERSQLYPGMTASPVPYRFWKTSDCYRIAASLCQSIADSLPKMILSFDVFLAKKRDGAYLTPAIVSTIYHETFHIYFQGMLTDVRVNPAAWPIWASDPSVRLNYRSQCGQVRHQQLMVKEVAALSALFNASESLADKSILCKNAQEWMLETKRRKVEIGDDCSRKEKILEMIEGTAQFVGYETASYHWPRWMTSLTIEMAQLGQMNSPMNVEFYYTTGAVKWLILKRLGSISSEIAQITSSQDWQNGALDAHLEKNLNQACSAP